MRRAQNLWWPGSDSQKKKKKKKENYLDNIQGIKLEY